MLLLRPEQVRFDRIPAALTSPPESLSSNSATMVFEQVGNDSYVLKNKWGQGIAEYSNSHRNSFVYAHFQFYDIPRADFGLPKRRRQNRNEVTGGCHIEMYTPEQCDKEKEPFLFLPGINRSEGLLTATQYHDFIKKLGDKEKRPVVLFCADAIRGVSAKEYPKVEAELLKKVVQENKIVDTQNPNKKATVIGYSYGALPATFAATSEDFSPQVDKLILLSPVSVIRRSVLRLVAGMVRDGRKTRASIASQPSDRQQEMVERSHLPRIINAMSDRGQFLKRFRAILSHDLRERIKKSHVPCVVISQHNDQIILADQLGREISNIGASEVHTFTTHTGPQVDPDRVVHAIQVAIASEQLDRVKLRRQKAA